MKKRDLFKLLATEYLDGVYGMEEEYVLKFMDDNYKQFKCYSRYDIFYLCKRSSDEFFIADSTESLKSIILNELVESTADISDIKVLRMYKYKKFKVIIFVKKYIIKEKIKILIKLKQ